MARTKIHSDNNLQTGSDYLEYHIRMYVETLLWLRDHECDANREIYYWNAILEDNLIHARLLIDFVCKTQARSDDILAIDYFHDLKNLYVPLDNQFLTDWAKIIGGKFVHITTKPMPALKSHQSWPIFEIAKRLIPGLTAFLDAVPETRLANGVKNDCDNHLVRLHSLPNNMSLNVST